MLHATAAVCFVLGVLMFKFVLLNKERVRPTKGWGWIQWASGRRALHKLSYAETEYDNKLIYVSKIYSNNDNTYTKIMSIISVYNI